jgi:predicted Zn-dependent protease
MREKRFASVLMGLFLLCLLCFPIACAVNPVTGEHQLMLLSEEEEIRLGQETDSRVVSEYGIYRDDRLTGYLDGVGKRLAKISHRPGLPYEFKVLDTPVVNAFAVPGGYVYFTRGILSNLNSEAELACVMGHELGHITARHSAQQYSRAQLAQLTLGSAMMFSQTLQVLAPLAQMGVSMLFLSYSRDNEREADDLGVAYSSQAGYDATHMALFFETLERMKPVSDKSGLPEWFSTHPNPEDRIGTVQREAKKWQKDLGLKNFKVNRDAYLKRINGMVYGEDPQEGFVEKDVFYHPLLRFQFPVPENWTFQNTRSMVQMTSRNKDAAIMFTLSSAKSPDEAARNFVQKNRARLMASDRRDINGLSAVRTVSRVMTHQGTLEIMSNYVQKGAKVYEFHGLAPENVFRSYQSVFQNTMGGFRQLTDKRMLNRKPYRIQVAPVPRTGTVKQALKALGAPDRKLQAWAVMNGKTLDETVRAGMLLKIVK